MTTSARRLSVEIFDSQKTLSNINQTGLPQESIPLDFLVGCIDG